MEQRGVNAIHGAPAGMLIQASQLQSPALLHSPRLKPTGIPTKPSHEPGSRNPCGVLGTQREDGREG